MKRLVVALVALSSLALLLTGCAPGDPFGVVESVESNILGVQIKGWVTDTSDPGSDVGIHVYIDDKYVLEGWARSNRGDIARAIPQFSEVRGYNIRLPIQTKGKHKVCAFAINVGEGKNNPLLGCKTIWSEGHSPAGSFDSIRNRGNGLVIEGWAIDPDSEKPVQIDTYLDGKFLQTTHADAYSKNLAIFLGKDGANRGISFTLPKDFVVASDVCLWAVNVGRGRDSFLGCKKAPIHTVNVNGIEISARVANNSRGS